MSFVEEASGAIRESGGRFTAQRRLIVELLAESTGHLDADRLYHLAHQRDTSVSLATVYRTLNVLEDAGLIDQRYFSPDHERKYYEPATAEEHYHFTCRVCRRVIEFESDFVDAIRRQLAEEIGVRVDHACVCLEGLCHDCLAQDTE